MTPEAAMQVVRSVLTERGWQRRAADQTLSHADRKVDVVYASNQVTVAVRRLNPTSGRYEQTDRRTINLGLPDRVMAQIIQAVEGL